MKCRPPPVVGTRLYGPAMSDRARAKRGRFGTVYHVRAVVDHVESEDWAHLYQVVLRWWSPRKGWRYIIECQFGFTPLSGDRALYESHAGAPSGGVADE
jgi:hypothetical protein